jgi:F-type H+-transporting ATPase subunit a
MGDIQITTDEIIYWQSGWFKLNATILFTWIVMAALVGVSFWVRSRLTSKTTIPRIQNLMEVLIETIQKQIGDVSGQNPARFVPFIGTLFLYIAAATLLSIVPGFRPPTASLSTTAALATCVFFAVPFFGIRQLGFATYVGQYLRPTWLMLPFNVIGELSRTLALAIRLYGNMMSGAVIAAVLLAFVPLFVPVVMQLLGLITGLIQAYIFAVLAMVYIASATRVGNTRVAAGHDNQKQALRLEAAPADPLKGK